jgi:hypothetical protein
LITHADREKLQYLNEVALNDSVDYADRLEAAAQRIISDDAASLNSLRIASLARSVATRRREMSSGDSPTLFNAHMSGAADIIGGEIGMVGGPIGMLVGSFIASDLALHTHVSYH